MARQYKVVPISAETVYQAVTLLISAFVTYVAYQLLVYPKVRALEQSGEAAAATSSSFWLIIKDAEQMLCFILFFWALFIIGWKFAWLVQQRRVLSLDLVGLESGRRIIPEDSLELSQEVQNLPEEQRGSVVARATLTALNRFKAGNSIPEVAAASDSVCENEAARLDSELSMVRYIAWAIPSIGFIGTVRGIGQALGNAQSAMDGDISLVTENLGTAFNSTLLALLISILLMFIVHQLQSFQEGFITDAQDYLQERLIGNLFLPRES